MENDFDSREAGMTTLLTKTLLVLYSGMLAFIGGKAEAATAYGPAQPYDEAFTAKLRSLKRKPQLVLKLNMANPLASRAMMHTSHRSHSSHSSHYSSSGGGHSSHTSHSSHYSSSSYTPSSSSSSSYSSPSYSRPKTKTKYVTKTRRSTSTPSPTYRSTRITADHEFETVYALGDRVLRLGDRGADVMALQQLLLLAGYTVVADGNFGLGTNAAVKSFQRTQGLPADGVVGQQTITALQQH